MEIFVLNVFFNYVLNSIFIQDLEPDTYLFSIVTIDVDGLESISSDAVSIEI